jgi:spermidine synthase
LACLYAASGFGTLALETLWIREITLRVGSTMVAASLVVGVFFLAAALGNLLGSALSTRVRRPLVAYGWFELSAAISALILFHLAKSSWLSPQPELWLWGGGIGMAALFVGIPSFLSGASFSFLSQQAVPSSAQRVTVGGVLYGANLIGATAGVLAGSVVLPWFWGMDGAFLFSGGVLIAGGLLALRLAAKGQGEFCRAWPASGGLPSFSKSGGPPQAETAALQEERAGDSSGKDSCLWALTLFFLCGALSLATQGLLISWAKQILQGSVYALSGVLASFIFGLGAGSWLAAWLRRRGWDLVKTWAGFALASALLLFCIPWMGRALAGGIPPLLGREPMEMMGRTLGWSVLFLAPLTICLGVIFPLSWEIWKTRGSSSGEGQALGRIVAANKVGAALGVGLGVFVLLPVFGLSGGTYFLGAAYALLAVALLGMTSGLQARGWMMAAGLSAVVGLIGTFLPQRALGLWPDEKEHTTLAGPYGPVSVIEDTRTGSLRIALNTQQRLNGTGRALATQLHQAWLPLLFADSVERVAVIGMASGITASGVLDFPVKELTAIELVPEVVRVAREHFQPWNGRLFSDSRVRIVEGDGRLVLRTLKDPQDVVICDLLFPQEDGAANLYSRDFFQEVREQLSPGGVFCLWLPCYQLDERTAGIIVRTFAEVFPHAIAVRANFDPIQPVIGLVGSRLPLSLGLPVLQDKLGRERGKALALRSPFFLSPDHAWLAVVGDLQVSRQSMQDIPLTTDNHPLLAYLGPADPGPGGKLVGMPFAKWVGQYFDQPVWPSVDAGGSPVPRMMDSSRAARAYYIAAVAESRIKGDVRSEATRLGQIALWLRRAHEANPAAILPAETLGK